MLRFIIYDPYGVYSYQTVSITSSHSFKIEYSVAVGNKDVFKVKAGGSYERTVEEQDVYYSSTNPSNPGPGIGDTVVYDLVCISGKLHGDVRYHPIYGTEVDSVDYFKVEEPRT